MVTPSSASNIFKSRFPLFNKLLTESKGDNYRQENQCPASAPILTQRREDNHRKGDNNRKSLYRDLGTGRNMEKHSSGKESDAATTSPIVLQDPPKAKLKRQLSINTVEQTEALRIHKKTTAFYRNKYRHDETRNDEVDGSEPVDLPKERLRNQRLGLSSPYATSGSLGNLRQTSSSSGDLRSASSAKSAVSQYTHSPSIFCTPPEDERSRETSIYENRPLPSPNRFCLNDIGLTSPFMSSNTATGTSTSQDEVFVFPDTASPRKYSPYKCTTSQAPSDSTRYEESERGLDLSVSKRKRAVGESSASSPNKYDRDIDSSDARYSDRSREYDAMVAAGRGRFSSCSRDGEDFETSRGYVSPSKGFSWPKTATISEPVTFSPRTVLANKPTASSPRAGSSDIDDRTRLRMLEREHARATEIFGSPSKTRDSPTKNSGLRHSSNMTSSSSSTSSSSRRDFQFRTTLRSVSDVDLSPNENEIRDTEEDVQNRYMRSISDPRCSPTQLRGVIQRPSPLARDAGSPRAATGGDAGTDQTTAGDRYRDPWRDDVKRRLFMKGETTYQGYQRQGYEPDDSASSGASTDIPEEVIHFLHSRNFHPEQLEDLKHILRQGGAGSPPTTSSAYSPRSTSYGDRPDVTSHTQRRRGQEESGGRRAERRRFGDIDVRLTCEDFSEKMSEVADMLKELDHETKKCKCGRIESAMMQMIDNAYKKLASPDHDVTMTSLEHYKSEKNETDKMVYNSMKILCGIKCLCKYGRTLEDVYSGSIIFRIHCPNIDALLDLWQVYKMGDLQSSLQEAFVTEELLEQCGCSKIVVKVKIEWTDYLLCKEELELLAESSINRTPTKQIAVIHARSRSEPASVTKQANQIQLGFGYSPTRERICSDSSVELSPRRAFKEINAGKYPKRSFLPESVVSFYIGQSALNPITKVKVVEKESQQENVSETDVTTV